MKQPLVKRSFAAVLAAAMLSPTALAAGLDSFVPQASYTNATFSDVPANAWYAENVASAYELGLMQGSGAGQFNPSGRLTVGEMLALVCRVHAIYHTGSASFTASNPWYAVYVDYAVQNGIIKNANTLNCDAPATRAQFAAALSAALPDEALAARNDIADGAIPDVPMSAANADAIYRLYRAGVLTGNDSAGTFTPSASIERSAVAALVTRAVNPDLRQQVSLQQAPALDFSVYWVNNIQAPYAYEFRSDGTVVSYSADPAAPLDPSKFQKSQTSQYRIEGNHMILTYSGGFQTTLELITPETLAAMGESILEELPAGTPFFYETSFVPTDAPEQAFYLVPSTRAVQPQNSQSKPSTTLKDGDRLTLTGVLTQETETAPNGWTFTSYVLRLDTPHTFTMSGEGTFTVDRVQLKFAQDNMQSMIGKQITVSGSAFFGHTAYHITPIVLQDVTV